MGRLIGSRGRLRVGGGVEGWAGARVVVEVTDVVMGFGLARRLAAWYLLYWITSSWSASLYKLFSGCQPLACLSFVQWFGFVIARGGFSAAFEGWDEEWGVGAETGAVENRHGARVLE